MERRGAAEVVAVDVLDPARWDWPAGSDERTAAQLARRKRGGDGFEQARAALGSSVQRHDLSVYDLDPAAVGEFDFVYLGSLLLHLRDPVGALERVRSVCRGELLVVDNHDPVLSLLFPRRPVARLEAVGRPWWWQGNVSAVVRWVEAAGFVVIAAPQRLRMPAGAGQPRPPLRWRGARELLNRRFGDPHVAVLARPS